MRKQKKTGKSRKKGRRTRRRGKERQRGNKKRREEFRRGKKVRRLERAGIAEMKGNTRKSSKEGEESWKMKSQEERREIEYTEYRTPITTSARTTRRESKLHIVNNVHILIN